MGTIRDSFGTISVESRWESFIVHAGYGYEMGSRQLEELRPGDVVEHPRGQRWKIKAMYEDRADLERIEGLLGAPGVSLPFPALVFVPDYEVEADGALAERWRDVPHPEFRIGDLDDLIEALTDYRASLP